MRYILSVYSLFFLIAPCFADNKLSTQTESNLPQSREPEFNIIFGISPFVGILGLEILNDRHSFGIGLPGHMSYRYYYTPSQDTKFWGMYIGGYSANEISRTVEGVKFSEVSSSYIGAGIGYRWQWPSGWNVSASIALEYYDDEYSNPGSTQTATETGLSPFPGINAAYKF